MTATQSRYEAPDMTKAIERMAKGLIKRAAEGDLEAVSALANAESILHMALAAAADAAHSEPNAYSWSEIGRELGMTRQAAQKRFAR